MQTCFFALNGLIPREEAISKIKEAIRKTYGKRGDVVVQKNFAVVDQALYQMHQVVVPEAPGGTHAAPAPPPVPNDATEFGKKVIGEIIAWRGDNIPVSALPADGTYPTGTSAWEKRNITQSVPVWETDLCIQCGKCVLVCPHAVIRAKVADSAALDGAPESFKTMHADS